MSNVDITLSGNLQFGEASVNQTSVSVMLRAIVKNQSRFATGHVCQRHPAVGVMVKGIAGAAVTTPSGLKGAGY